MLIKAHVRLDRYAGAALDAALAEIEEHRILTISSAEDVPSYRRTLEIAGRCRWVLPTFGVHPWNAVRYVTRHIDIGPSLDECPMIGEIGLDHHWVGIGPPTAGSGYCLIASWPRRASRTRWSTCTSPRLRAKPSRCSPATRSGGWSCTGAWGRRTPSAQAIEQAVQDNFRRLIRDDRWMWERWGKLLDVGAHGGAPLPADD